MAAPYKLDVSSSASTTASVSGVGGIHGSNFFQRQPRHDLVALGLGIALLIVAGAVVLRRKG